MERHGWELPAGADGRMGREKAGKAGQIIDYAWKGSAKKLAFFFFFFFARVTNM